MRTRLTAMHRTKRAKQRGPKLQRFSVDLIRGRSIELQARNEERAAYLILNGLKAQVGLPKKYATPVRIIALKHKRPRGNRECFIDVKQARYLADLIAREQAAVRDERAAVIREYRSANGRAPSKTQLRKLLAQRRRERREDERFPGDASEGRQSTRTHRPATTYTWFKPRPIGPFGQRRRRR